MTKEICYTPPMRRLLKYRLVRLALFLFFLPYGLALLYIFIPPPSTLMLSDLATMRLPKREWVPLDRISPNVVKAVLVSEDAAFCEHFGFDFDQIEKNLDKAADGRRYHGASTLTQQTAKNLFLWPGRSWLRKALEAPLTLWLELVMSKRRILEIYLNIAEWGDGVYGAQAASEYHFGASAEKLNLFQASLLAASLPDPARRHAGRPSLFLLGEAGRISGRALRQAPDRSCLK